MKLGPGTDLLSSTRNQAARLLGDQLAEAARRLRDVSGRLDGLSYRVRGHHPDPDVADDVLADRIRSSLGPVEQRLDVPHIHVMVEDRVALLHGVVGTQSEGTALERAVASVSGVKGVESYLHVGLGSGDTRPSEGRDLAPPSAAMQSLLEATNQTGIDEHDAPRVLRTVLAVFAERLPAGEREQVGAHLPKDVHHLFVPPRQHGDARPPRTVAELVARITSLAPTLSRSEAERATASILRELRALVPDEAADVNAVLPRGLQPLWRTEQPA